MKVIFLKDVKGVAQRGIVKDVADGYALNKLLPQGLAAYASPQKVAEVEKAMREKKAADDVHTEQLVHEAQQLRGQSITVSAKANEAGKLYKHIAAEDIADAIKKQLRLEIDTHSIHNIEHVKTVGDHAISIARGKDTVELKVVVVRG